MTRARCVLRRRENFYKSLYYVYHSLSIGAFNKPHAQTYRFRFLSASLYVSKRGAY